MPAIMHLPLHAALHYLAAAADAAHFELFSRTVQFVLSSRPDSAQRSEALERRTLNAV